MKEFKKNILIKFVSIKKIMKISLPIYLYNFKKILNCLFYIKKLKFICFFSVKSNDNIFLLKIIKKTLNKFDVVSIGEIEKILLISNKKPKIIFSGSGKSISELLIFLNFNLFFINIESIQELFKIYFFCNNYKIKINIMFRINPNIDALTEKKISTGNIYDKFGICLLNLKQIFMLSKILKRNINILGYDFHIGSQITKLKPIKKLLFLIKILLKLKNYKYLDIGGGLGVDYFLDKKKINLKNFYKSIEKILKKNNIYSKIIIELGRYIFCNNCFIISKINYLKFNNKNKIAIINLGMNDVIRPSLYKSYHKFESLNKGRKISNLFGPICESSDKYNNSTKIKLKNNSTIFMFSTGSYCKVLSSNYNSKKKIFEILYYKNKIKIIFKKENFYNLLKNYD